MKLEPKKENQKESKDAPKKIDFMNKLNRSYGLKRKKLKKNKKLKILDPLPLPEEKSISFENCPSKKGPQTPKISISPLKILLPKNNVQEIFHDTKSQKPENHPQNRVGPKQTNGIKSEWKAPAKITSTSKGKNEQLANKPNLKGNTESNSLLMTHLGKKKGSFNKQHLV